MDVEWERRREIWRLDKVGRRGDEVVRMGVREGIFE